jgi:hypothetical protein
MSPWFVPNLPKENGVHAWPLSPGTQRQKAIVIFLGLTPFVGPFFFFPDSFLCFKGLRPPGKWR